MSTEAPFRLPLSRFRADLLLLLTAVIWGSAFVAQRVAAESTSVFLFNALRFFAGALVLLPFAIRSRARLTQPISSRAYLNIEIAGLLLFGAATLQQLGMRYTTAGNAGFITGLYVVFVPAILALGGRQRLGLPVWGAALLAALGLFMLSTGGRFRLALGDALELGGAILFALHVIWIDHLAGKVHYLLLAILQYMVVGALSLLIGIWIEPGIMDVINTVWVPILYTGILSIGLGYTLQVVGQQVAPPTDASILLSMEAPFAAFFGWLLLGEKLTGVQLLGCGLMLMGMLLPQFSSIYKLRGSSQIQSQEP